MVLLVGAEADLAGSAFLAFAGFFAFVFSLVACPTGDAGLISCDLPGGFKGSASRLLGAGAVSVGIGTLTV